MAQEYDQEYLRQRSASSSGSCDKCYAQVEVLYERDGRGYCAPCWRDLAGMTEDERREPVPAIHPVLKSHLVHELEWLDGAIESARDELLKMMTIGRSRTVLEQLERAAVRSRGLTYWANCLLREREVYAERQPVPGEERWARVAEKLK